MEQETKAPEKRVELVYTGSVTLDGGKPGVALRILDEQGTLGREIYFARKAFPSANIGGVYSVAQTSDTAFVLSGRRFVRMHDDKALVAEWQLESKAVQLREDAAKMEKSAKDVPEAFQMLAPLRMIYRKALPDRKRAIEILLLDYLRR